MGELIKILRMSDSDIEQYVDNRITNLDFISSDIDEVALEEGEIYKGWINTNVSYLPSGNRSKGFKLTKQFYIDFVNYIKKSLGTADISVIKNKFSSEKLIKLIKE